MAAVFLFHRDLRLEDNTALLAAIKEHASVVPLFIFPEDQINPKRNKYFSHHAVRFMCECLHSLEEQLTALGSKLLMIRGDDTVSVLSDLFSKYPFKHLYYNKDFGVYAQERDARIGKWGDKNGISIHAYEDYGLVRHDEGLLPDGRPYKVLAQYYARYQKDLRVRMVDTLRLQNGHFLKNAKFPKGIKGVVTQHDLSLLYDVPRSSQFKGGRAEGVNILRHLSLRKNYVTERDYPAMEGTTRASPHLRFGTISIREMYWTLNKHFGKDHPLIRELVFRDFYYKIYNMHPELQRGTAYRSEMDKKISWKDPMVSKQEWLAWTTGTTGFPLVDAGMRQLITEGWMHNRVRMLVASFATRYLYLDWRACARYFYSRLVDADPVSNTAGWQWAAGIGVDSAPYFRAPFNPYLQSKRFDKDAAYIKRWVPELHDVAPAHIHRWGEPKIRGLYPNTSYPSPMLDQKTTSKESQKMWMEAAHK